MLMSFMHNLYVHVIHFNLEYVCTSVSHFFQINYCVFWKHTYISPKKNVIPLSYHSSKRSFCAMMLSAHFPLAFLNAFVRIFYYYAQQQQNI